MIADGRAHRASPATGCSSGRRTCARRRTATRTSTTCSPSSSPRRTTSRWTRASPTPTAPASPTTSRRPTSRSCRRSGTTGSEPNDSRKIGSDEAERVLDARLLPRRDLPRPLRAVPEVPTERAYRQRARFRRHAGAHRHADVPRGGEHRRVPRAHARGRARRRHPRRRRQQPRRHRRPRRRRPAPSSGSIEVLRRPRKIGLGDAYRAGFTVGLDRGYDVARADRRRPLARPGRAARPAREPSTTAPTSRSARATCPAARSRTGRGTGGRCRSGATATRRSCSACRSATRRRATACTAPTIVEEGRLRDARAPRATASRSSSRTACGEHGGRIDAAPDHVHRPRARRTRR